MYLMKVKMKLLMALTLIPVSTISIAATAKASELDNEMQNQKMLNQLRMLRHKMIASDKIESNFEEAIKRYQNQTGYYGQELHEKFHSDLSVLVEQGMVQVSSDGVIGGAPSDI